MMNKRKTIDDDIFQFEKNCVKLENKIHREVVKKGMYDFEIKEKYRNDVTELREKLTHLYTNKEVFIHDLDFDDFVKVGKQYLTANANVIDTEFHKLESDIKKLDNVGIVQSYLNDDVELDWTAVLEYKRNDRNEKAIQTMKKGSDFFKKILRTQNLINIKDNSTYVFGDI